MKTINLNISHLINNLVIVVSPDVSQPELESKIKETLQKSIQSAIDQCKENQEGDFVNEKTN